jgi:RsiW-degrading membrane proteinase PrsW (M82 family)
MDFEILAIALSFVFGIGFVAYLRRFDVYDREPYFNMALTTLLGGAVSIVVCSVLYGLVGFTPLSFIQHESMLGSLLIIGPVEETAKLIGLLAAWPFIRKEINEVNDGLVYMACVALGFSLIENYFYAVRGGAETHYLLYYRLFITSPAHIVMSVFVGMAFYRIKFKHTKWVILLYALVWSSLIHGLYDGFLFSNLGFISLGVLLVALQQSFVLIRVGNLRSPFRLSFDNFIYQERKRSRKTTVCPSCHQENKDNVLLLRRTRIYDCKHCKMLYAEKNALIRLYHYYIPPLGGHEHQY